MNCIVTAGGRLGPEDTLAAVAPQGKKALIDIHGRPMIDYVLQAVAGSSHIDTILILGLEATLPGPYAKPVYYLPDHGSLVGNVLAGLQWVRRNNPAESRVLLASSDTPALTPAIVDHFLAQCREREGILYYSYAYQATLEARFPGSNRTFVPLKGGRIVGGDLVLVHPRLADGDVAFWESLTNARKNAWQIARAVGLGTLLKYLFRQLSVPDIEALGTRLLGGPFIAVESPHAEVAMDVDKRVQLELLTADLARTRPATSPAATADPTA